MLTYLTGYGVKATQVDDVVYWIRCMSADNA